MEFYIIQIFSFNTFVRISSLKIIGRVSADPDYLPRGNDFGLNVTSFLQQYHPSQCPSAFLPMAVLCCDMDSEKRYDYMYKCRPKILNYTLPVLHFAWNLNVTVWLIGLFQAFLCKAGGVAGQPADAPGHRSASALRVGPASQDLLAESQPPKPYPQRGQIP